MSSNAIESRVEQRQRILVDPLHLPLDVKKFEVQKFPEPFSHTLYFGFDNGIFPKGFAFRIRAYGDSLIKSGKVGVLDKSLPCFLEIKHSIEDKPGVRNKIRHATTIGEALSLAQSKDRIFEVFGDDLTDDVKNKLSEFYASGVNCKPVCGVSYERTHFTNGSRLTLDSNITSFSVTEYDGELFVHKAGSELFSLLEIKAKNAEIGQEANISKFKLSSPWVGSAVHIEPGMDMKEDGDWVLEERELKIDTSKDPRDTLKNIIGDDEISVGRWKDNNPTLMQFVIAGENGICIMGREGITEKMALKHKKLISSQSGVITRSETVQPYSEEKLNQIIVDLGGDPETVERAPYFTRHRTIRLAVCRETGNIFAITADKCSSEGDIADLNQVEIEYRGKITQRGITNIEQDEVDSDFQKVSKWLYGEYRKHQQVPMLSSITKYAWSTSKVASRQVLSERIRQGNNAVLEVDEVNRRIRKIFDLWGTRYPDNVVSNYQSFRDSVAKIYDIPELIELNYDTTSLSVTESLVNGEMAKTVLAHGTELETIEFIYAALLPLSGQIMENTQFDLGDGRISKRPLKVPVDIKPDNFMVTADGNVVFVDMFPPLCRLANGEIMETYGAKDGKHDAWVYGEASILITRFLMRAIMANPDRVNLITQTVLQVVSKIDPSGMLLSEMQVNALREKTIKDFSKIATGASALTTILARI
jgi:hypothetical protein